MKLSKLALFIEGGRAVGEVDRVSKADIEPTLKQVKSQVLDKLGIKKFGPIGSVGKKESSGDLDIGVEVPDGIEIKDLHQKVLDLGLEKSKGNSPTLLSFKFPIYDEKGKTDKWAQVDLMFGKKDWLEFGYWAPDESESKYSGVQRNILMAAIVRYSREMAGKPGKTWAIDLNKGISRKTRGTVTDKKGKEKEAIIAKTMITNSPEKVVKLLNIATKGNWAVSDFTQSFEKLWDKTKSVFPKDVLEKIKDYVNSGVTSSKKEIPVMEKTFISKLKSDIFTETK